jgi:hypothetical protein
VLIVAAAAATVFQENNMMIAPQRIVLALLPLLLVAVTWLPETATAFGVYHHHHHRHGPARTTSARLVPTTSTGSRTARVVALFMAKRGKKEDLSFIETRDMTREEMLQLNQKNEDIMQAELAGMTVFSLLLSAPLLYLVWVAFFSETAGDFDL